MLPLLERHWGTVTLHDFFLSDLMNFVEVTEPGSEAFRRSLYFSHSYHALLAHAQKGAETAVWTYPCSLPVLLQAQGVIVHSEYAKRLAQEWFDADLERWVTIPQPRRPPASISREQARAALGVPAGAFLVCAFGMLGPAKLNHRLLDAWVASTLSENQRCHLVFVGDGQKSDYGRSLTDVVKRCGTAANHVRITGYVDRVTYHHYLAAADIGVQLRTRSRGETSRAVLDCMAYGMATIVNDHATIKDLPKDVVMKVPEECQAEDLTLALEVLYRDDEKRKSLGSGARRHVQDQLDPAIIALQYTEALERFANDHPLALRRHLLTEIGGLPALRPPSDEELAKAASCIAENSPERSLPQLLVDITQLALEDTKAGIQRSVRGILAALLQSGPAGYRVEPVYRHGRTYRYARKFTLDYLELERLSLDDAPVAVSPDDVFLGLDWDPAMDEPARQWLLHHRQRGMKVYFVIYDLLPWRRSDWFPPEMEPSFRAWLMGLWRIADGFVCISRATADDLLEWLDAHQQAGARGVEIGYFHIGCDIEASRPSRGLSVQDTAVLEGLKGQQILLMVGTVEPRKGHGQALAAMGRLWAGGEKTRLVIVGKQGWMVESLAERLRAHAECGHRLFWLEQVSDEMLLALYRITSALLAASEGEGFGLPLLEAARKGVAIIARDLPVFREIVGEHAFYFSGTGAREFEEALRRWLALYRRGEHIRSDGLHWLTWKESAEQLLGVALWGKWYKHWKPTFSVLEGPSQLPILPQDAQPPGTRINRKSVYPDP
jgi:glycosyltransferase involved in cell wall biosynthesis